jgi:hypothetical protein
VYGAFFIDSYFINQQMHNFLVNKKESLGYVIAFSDRMIGGRYFKGIWFDIIAVPCYCVPCKERPRETETVV